MSPKSLSRINPLMNNVLFWVSKWILIPFLDFEKLRINTDLNWTLEKGHLISFNSITWLELDNCYMCQEQYLGQIICDDLACLNYTTVKQNEPVHRM